ncbi:histidine phosphatase family protein [Patescibacteria group bacterium]|nr:histidine phosphatase family protein [Patescibacteria group bacterium]
MKIYLVRHGETLGNQKKIHQEPDSPLSDIGLSQAHLVAHRFSKISFDALLASPYKRTQQTASEISKKTNHPIETIKDLHEYDRPTSIQGLSFEHSKSKQVMDLIKKHIDNPNWHYGNEENFFDFKKRIQTVYLLLEKRPEKILTLVSHGLTIAMLIGLAIIGNDITPDQFLFLFYSMNSSNTGISVLEYEKAFDSNENRWKLRTFNDDAHLG